MKTKRGKQTTPPGDPAGEQARDTRRKTGEKIERGESKGLDSFSFKKILLKETGPMHR